MKVLPLPLHMGNSASVTVGPYCFSSKCNTGIYTNFREMFFTHLTVLERTRTAIFFTTLDTTLQFGPAAVTECCQVVASARCGMFGIRTYEQQVGTCRQCGKS